MTAKIKSWYESNIDSKGKGDKMDEKRDLRTLTFRMDREDHREFKALAARAGVAMVDVLTQCVNEFISKHKAKENAK